MQNAITIETLVQAPLQTVWDSWTSPEHITKWAHASEDWHAPEAENDVRVGGRFKTVMAAKDGSASFDFTGEYTSVEQGKIIAYTMDDGRKVMITFEEMASGIKIVETFDPESENAPELQRQGWQAILDTFKQYTESL